MTRKMRVVIAPERRQPQQRFQMFDWLNDLNSPYHIDQSEFSNMTTNIVVTRWSKKTEPK